MKNLHDGLVPSLGSERRKKKCWQMGSSQLDVGSEYGVLGFAHAKLRQRMDVSTSHVPASFSHPPSTTPIAGRTCHLSSASYHCTRLSVVDHHFRLVFVFSAVSRSVVLLLGSTIDITLLHVVFQPLGVQPGICTPPAPPAAQSTCACGATAPIL